jgi:8-oxo-dGTP diphosphatase
MRRSIDLGSDRPVYKQIADALRDAITGGELQPGAQLPSEAALTATYGVAQGTVRRALSLLHVEHLTEARHGRGVFVRAPDPVPPARHTVNVLAVILDKDGLVLAVRERDGALWRPPGGLVELDETLPGALARHVQAQTGLTVEVGAVTGLYKDTQNAVLTVAGRCRVIDGQPRAGGPAACGWLAVPELRRHVDPVAAGMITDACSDDPRTRVRAHHGPDPR